MSGILDSCCICSSDKLSDWKENPLLACDGARCYVTVHQGMFLSFFSTHNVT